jgi:Lipocalin-like domain
MTNSELTASVSHNPKDLVGTWTLVSVVTERDGRRFDTYGPNAKGHLVFDAIGRYSIIFIAGGLPKFASGNRSSTTAEESNAVVSGSFAHFGTYFVDEVDKSFTFQVERATFPNWDGKNTKRSFGIRGDELHFTDPHSSGGGVATTIFELAKSAR